MDDSVFADLYAGIPGSAAVDMPDGRRVTVSYEDGVFSAVVAGRDGVTLMRRTVRDGDYLTDYRRSEGRRLAVRDVMSVSDMEQAESLARYLRRRERRRRWERTPRQRELKAARTMAEAERRAELGLPKWPVRRRATVDA